ncbi:MAG: phosphotriesterase [Bacteroidota bacterium]
MEKRWYLPMICLLSIITICLNAFKRGGDNDFVMTVAGKILVTKMGLTLPHEHMVTDFGGAEDEDVTYTEQEAISLFLPYLMKLKTSGVTTMVECTPSFIGKNVKLLKTLSKLSGLNIITNTGYYAAVGQKYLPAHALKETEKELAKRWTDDFTYGIDGTGIRPGFIKLGTDAAPLNQVAVKLVKAGAVTHLNTGLKIAIHTGSAEAAHEEANILKHMGVDLSAFIWVHAQNDRTGSVMVKLAKQGVWISLDGISEREDALTNYISAIKKLKSEKLLHRLLLSQDDGFAVSRIAGKVKFDAYENGNKKPYTTLLSILKPRLLNGVLTQQEFEMITVINPGKAFSIERLPLNK